MFRVIVCHYYKSGHWECTLWLSSIILFLKIYDIKQQLSTPHFLKKLFISLSDSVMCKSAQGFAGKLQAFFKGWGGAQWVEFTTLGVYLPSKSPYPIASKLRHKNSRVAVLLRKPLFCISPLNVSLGLLCKVSFILSLKRNFKHLNF